MATEEEYLEGKNAHAADGSIKSSIVGKADFDEKNKEVSVKGKTSRMISVGDTVIGTVTGVRDSKVILKILDSDGNHVGLNNAELPVRNISKQYVKNPRDYFKVGDVIKAKVTEANRYKIDVETNKFGLGVIIAYCSKCRNEMEFNKDRLLCLNCGNSEDRKWFEKKEDDSYQSRPRREGGFNDRRNVRRSFNNGGNRRYNNNRSFHRGSRDNNRSNNKYGNRNNNSRSNNYNNKNSEKRFWKWK